MFRYAQPSQTITRTRFPELGLEKQGPNLWRFLDLSEPRIGGRFSAVGEYYRTKAEAMGDLERYARESWGL
jgi:hypothetical protein